MADPNSHDSESGADSTMDLSRLPNWVPISEKPAYSRRSLKIICIGAGFSGLTLAHKIKHEYGLSQDIDLTIYEKNAAVGGTWLENRYPGVACDIPAHAYTFLFEPNPNWSKFYSPGPEIQQYIEATVKKWGLDEKVQFNSRVIEAVWNEEAGKWKLTIEQGGSVTEDEADILVNAGGFLNKWKWPEIEGLSDFQGKLLHTANWDDNYSYDGKRVAVIGNGSTGLQCVPSMQPKVSKLVNYARNPTWISVNFCADKAKDGRNFAYTEEERQRFRDTPEELFRYRRELEASVNGFYYGMMRGHPFQRGLQDACVAQITSRTKDNPEMKRNFMPEFRPGCRRLSPGEGYIEAFTQPNCELCTAPIERITANGVMTTDGKEEEFDAIVCATGFDTSFIPAWKMVGRNGVTLQQRWEKHPDAFFAVQVDKMPNYFMFNGPNCPISHGSVLTEVSWTCDYILRWVKKMATQDIKSLEVRPESVSDYNIRSQELLKQTVWADHCKSWYKNGKASGWVTGPYGGSILNFKDALENIGSEHFLIDWRTSNRFNCLGNGQHEGENDGQGDLAHYMQWPEQ